MCGIAGTINRTIDHEPVLRSLKHRGPDAQHACHIDALQLFHSRLSVVDSLGGGQPMSRGQLTLVFNGEIYNHQDLRKQFSLDCGTQSDTETLLALVEAIGLDALPHLDGMFAFALFDRQSSTLWLARDRAGKKPLYLWHHGDQFAFASELNTLHLMAPLSVNDSAVNEFLSSGVFAGSDTAFNDVAELGPGTVCRIDLHSATMTHTAWYTHAAEQSHPVDQLSNLEQAADLVEQSLNTAIRRRLLSSDLEVGAFLSGGIDSGLVCALAASHTDRLKTFTVSFDGQFDESPLARSVAQRIGSDHHELSVDFNNLESDIEDIVGNYGEPVCDDSIIPTWYVSREARKHVTVVLTGDGADELFGGYRRYVPYSTFGLFHSGQSGHGVARALHALLPAPDNKMGAYNYAYRFLAMMAKGGVERYLASTTQVDVDGLVDHSYSRSLLQSHAELADSANSGLSKMLLMDFRTLLLGTYLPKMDIGSMAHSLEARSPFLSRELLLMAPSLPDAHKIRGRETKYLLRHIAKRHLPDDVRTAPKRGFETPLVSWINGRLRNPVHDVLSPSNAWVRQFYHAAYIDKLLRDETRLAPTQRARMLWMLLCTELWHRRLTHG